MKERFDYDQIPTETAQQRTVNSLNGGPLTKENAKAVAQAASADVVIGGSYALASDKRSIYIRVSIFLTNANQCIELPEFSNPVDGTIFQAIDKVSENIVLKIKEVAARQQNTPEDGNAKSLSQ